MSHQLTLLWRPRRRLLLLLLWRLVIGPRLIVRRGLLLWRMLGGRRLGARLSGRGNLARRLREGAH